MIKIGIDLSTTKIGWAIVSLGVLLHAGEQKMLLYNDDNLQSNIDLLHTMILHIINQCGEITTIAVGIELSNYSNPMMTNRFNEYCGIIEGFLWERSVMRKLIIKKFNSNQWQSLIGCKHQEERDERKARAKQWVNDTYNMNYESDDINDAICIASLLHLLKTTEETKKIKVAKIKVENKKIKSVVQIQKQILTRQATINKLDPVRNKKAIETKFAEIEKLKERLK